jgi:hypothetical protein
MQFCELQLHIYVPPAFLTRLYPSNYALQWLSISQLYTFVLPSFAVYGSNYNLLLLGVGSKFLGIVPNSSTVPVYAAQCSPPLSAEPSS